MASDQTSVSNNAERLRYEIRLGDTLAGFIAYRTEPGLVVLVHTEIDLQFEGRGLGTRLVAAALDDIRARGVSVVPLCPFVAAYISRHPDYADLAASDPVPSD